MLNMRKLVILLVSALVPFASSAATYKRAELKEAKAGWYEAKLSYAIFSGSSLATAANRSYAEEMVKLKQFVQQSKEFQKEETGKPENPNYYDAGGHVTMDRPDLIAVDYPIDEFLGGAHGNQFFRPYCYGIVQGRPVRLTIKNIMRPGIDALNSINKVLLAKLRKDERAAWIEDGTVKSVTLQQANRFSLTAKGLHFVFDPYEMGPYAAGPIDVDVSFRELRPYLNPNGPLHSLLR